MVVGLNLQAAGGSRDKGRLTSHRWGHWAGGRQKAALKTPAPPAGEQWCVRAARPSTCHSGQPLEPAVRVLLKPLQIVSEFTAESPEQVLHRIKDPLKEAPSGNRFWGAGRVVAGGEFSKNLEDGPSDTQVPEGTQSD